MVIKYNEYIYYSSLFICRKLAGDNQVTKVFLLRPSKLYAKQNAHCLYKHLKQKIRYL